MADLEKSETYYGYADVVDADTVGYYLQKEETIRPAYYELDDSSALASEAELVDSLGPPPAYTENSDAVEEPVSGYTDNSVGYVSNAAGYAVNSGYTDNNSSTGYGQVEAPSGYSETASGYSENNGYSSNDASEQTSDAPKVQPAASKAAAAKRTFPSRPWNEEFQVLMGQWNDAFYSITNESNESQRLLQTANSLQNLVDEFENRALEIGSIIISELHLPAAQRTVLPVDAGGIAGGEKYIAGGIFFKLAVDLHNLYGGDRFAAKAASRELLGLMHLMHESLFNSDVHPHFPLMCLITYRGFTLVASSCLPIGSDTLKYGSNDGGKTVMYSDPEINNIVRKLMKPLNLKRHAVGRTARVEIYGPADLEVHRGKDGRVYMLDTARVFPPLLPDKRRKGSFLYRLFRPEFVQAFSIPLSSDAFSGFQVDQAAENNDEVRSAYSQLIDVTIPETAKRLSARWKDDNVTEFSPDIGAALVREMKLSGINVEFLGLLRASLPIEDTVARKLIMCEIVARTLKSATGDTLRGINATTSDVVASVVGGLINLYFLQPAGDFWTWKIKLDIDRDFYGAIYKPEEGTHEQDLRKSIDIWPVFLRFRDLARLEVAVTREQFESGQPLPPTCIKSINPRLKRMYIFDYVRGYALAEIAAAEHGDQAEIKWQHAEEAYDKVLQRYPSGWHAFMHHGLTLFRLGEIKAKGGRLLEASGDFKKSEAEYALAARLKPQGAPNIFKNWGTLQKQMAQASFHDPEAQQRHWIRAINTLNKAYEMDPTDFMTLENIGLTLSNQGLYSPSTNVEAIDRIFQDSQSFFAKSLQLKPNLISSWLNSGIAFYYQASRHYDLQSGQSGDYFKKCYEQLEKAVNAQESRVNGIDMLYSAYFNWGMSLYVEGTHHLTAAQQAQSEETREAELSSAFDAFTQAQAKLLLAIKNNVDFHLSYHYSGLSLDKIAKIKSMRGAPSVDIADSLETALEKVEKAVSLSKAFSPALNLGRDVCRTLFQMHPTVTSWIDKATTFGERSKEVSPTMENCLLLGAAYVDKAIRLDEQSDQLLPTLRRAQAAYLTGLKIHTRSQRLTIPEAALSLIESPPDDLQHLWECLAFDDEPTHTQTLDIIQRITIHPVLQSEMIKSIRLLEYHNIVNKPKSMRVLKFAVMVLANLASLDSNRAEIVGADGKGAVMSGIAMAIQSPNKEIQNIALRSLVNLVQDAALCHKLVNTVSPLSDKIRLPEILAGQIQVAGSPVQTAFFLSYTLASLLKHSTEAARLFIQAEGINCILDLLDTKAGNVVGQTAAALDALCAGGIAAAGAASVSPGSLFVQAIYDRLKPADVPAADEEWFIWIINEIFIPQLGGATVCNSGFLPLITRALVASKGIICKYALLCAKQIVTQAVDGNVECAQAIEQAHLAEILKKNLGPDTHQVLHQLSNEILDILIHQGKYKSVVKNMERF